MKNAAVVGHKGMLGSMLFNKLVERLGAENVIGLDLPKINITEPDSLANSGIDKAEVIFNCAAYTNVDKAESDVDKAFLLNETGVENLSKFAENNGKILVHISTDFIFGKREKEYPIPINEVPAPLSVYGKSKLAGEQKLIESGCKFLLVRTAWLYGINGKNFVKTIISHAKRGNPLKVVNDQKGAPTYTNDLAEGLIGLVQKGKNGIYHYTNSGCATWYELACESLKLCNIDAEIKPVCSKEYSVAAERPEYSVLNISETENVLGNIRSWKEALADYVACENFI
jgi:dTDP-4-dehydrorhamnose reductase